MAGGRRVAGSLAITVHGAGGVIDLLVPPEAAALDVAREYSAQCRLPSVPALHTSRGRALSPHEPLAGAGITTGDLLVATGGQRSVPAGAGDRPARGEGVAGRDGSGGAAAWFCVAVSLALLAGWFASRSSGARYDATVALLVASSVLAVLPVGRFATHRAIAAPAFAGAAAYAVVWAPGAERLPTVIGVCALVAAVTAAVARALDDGADEALRVWVVVGVLVFLVSGAAVLLRAGPEVVWAVLLLLAFLAARIVPGYAVDVPDQFLIDLERLAVTAWSARERPTGRRGRTLVPPDAVEVVARRGTRLVTAASAAVWAVVLLAAPLLLATATLPIDRTGARVFVLLSGAALLLAARSYRHVTARALLRGAGLTCWVAVLVVVLGDLDAGDGTTLAVVAVLLAALLVVVAVATGRGWRSAWWSRRAEVAEGLAGSFAIASFVVAVGLFRSLWELKFRV